MNEETRRAKGSASLRNATGNEVAAPTRSRTAPARPSKRWGDRRWRVAGSMAARAAPYPPTPYEPEDTWQPFLEYGQRFGKWRYAHCRRESRNGNERSESAGDRRHHVNLSAWMGTRHHPRAPTGREMGRFAAQGSAQHRHRRWSFSRVPRQLPRVALTLTLKGRARPETTSSPSNVCEVALWPTVRIVRPHVFLEFTACPQ